jgi:hypothetical protein
MLECEAETTDAFVWSVVRDASLAPHFRDDTIVYALLSSSAASFLERHRGLLLESERHLLRRVIHSLRVACKTTPRWFPFGEHLPPLFFVPHGTAWAAVLRIVREEFDTILPDDTGLLLGLIEDWATSVAWWMPYPEGSEDVGKIALALLPHLNYYVHKDMRKRVLQVIVKIPKADRGDFLELVDRAGTPDRDDPGGGDLAELLLEGFSGVFACRDFPDAMVRLAEKQYYLSEDELETRERVDHPLALEPIFGIRHNLHTDFYPPSAIRGLFFPLLQSHPEKGVDFIVRLMNHASTWYGERKCAGDRLEPAVQVRMQIPGECDVTQWANNQLWCLYRGTSVGPAVLQTALMALESWLVGIGDADNASVEGWLLKLLRESNNVAVTAVVASVCNAYPEKVGRAGLAVLTCREFFAMDRVRVVKESFMPGSLANQMPMYDVEDKIYDDERRLADSRSHRKHDLEALAVKLQLGEYRDALWQMLDEYRSSLPEGGTQTAEDHLWRLALHRMDLRTYQPQLMEAQAAQEASDGDAADATDETRARQRVHFVPGPVDADVQEILDRHAPVQARQQADMALLYWGMAMWRGDSSDGLKTEAWRERLAESRQRNADRTDIAAYARGGPGFVAAVCVRDHWEEIEQEDRDWCVNMLIVEIERDCDSDDIAIQASRFSLDPSRPAAYVLPKL